MAISWEMDVGINATGAYQVSGRPFAKGGINATNATKVTFPSVTRWIYLVNNEAQDCRVGFSQLGVEGTSYFTVPKKDNDKKHATVRLELKISELWLSGSQNIDVCAGLTSIRTERTSMGAGLPSWSGSAGVG
jgi:hypothetical protein